MKNNNCIAIKKHKRRKYMFFLLFIACFMILGFAVLSTELEFSGVATIDSAKWDVKMQNVVVDTDSTVTATSTPTISNNNKLDFSVSLKEPGDFYAFTVDVVNSGGIDAMFLKIDHTSINDDSVYNFFYCDVFLDDGTVLEDYNLLNAGETKTILVLVGYNHNISSEDLPDSNTNVDIEIEFYFQQADEFVRNFNNYYLYTNSSTLQLNDEVLPEITTFNSASSAMTDLGANVCLNHLISVDSYSLEKYIQNTYVSFKVDDKVYNLKALFDNDVWFEELKFFMNKIFDDDECSFTEEDDYMQFNCSNDNLIVKYEGAYLLKVTDLVNKKYCQYNSVDGGKCDIRIIT